MAVAKYGITRDDLFPRKANRRPVARYRNPQTGETWSGRGRPPAWIEGKDRDTFAIDR
ncbi:H-NS family nucleoid-associated regulatory protein [Burkholderia cepacia]|uniref:H-NS histone family protein n=1 Tax=Burkholderia cepacia TaxID=292 RepID=UPI0039BEFB31